MCEVCGRHEPDVRDVGVASVPAAPVSVMWCEDCLKNHAVPLFVVETWLFTELPFDPMTLTPPPCPLAEWAQHQTVFLDGVYVQVREAYPALWEEERQRRLTQNV